MKLIRWLMLGLVCILVPEIQSNAENLGSAAIVATNGNEDFHPEQNRSTFGERIARFRHNADIVNFAWSPDNQRVAALAMLDREAFLWDIPSERTIVHFPRNGSIPYAIAFTRDGRYLAMSSTVIDVKHSDPALDDISTSISLFDGKSGGLIRHLPSFREGMTHSKVPRPITRSTPWDILIAKDANLAASFWNMEPFVVFYDATTWERLRTISIEDVGNMFADSAAISPDGKHFAVAGRVFKTPLDRAHLDILSEDTNIVIFDVAMGQVERKFPAHPGKINTLAYSPDGKFIASGAEQAGPSPTAPDYGETLRRDPGRIRIWNVATGERMRTYFADITQVHSVAWSPDGRLLAAGAAHRGDWKVYLFDTASDQLLDSVDVDDCFRVAFSTDGKSIAYNDGATLVVRAIDKE